MSNTELKPCPLCGGEVECVSTYSGVFEEIRAYVKCDSCGLIHWYSGIDTYDVDTQAKGFEMWKKKAHEKAKQMAVEAWNRRANE